jgi:hypothetical protein
MFDPSFSSSCLLGFARIDHVPAYHGAYLFSPEFIPRVPPNPRVRAWADLSFVLVASSSLWC